MDTENENQDALLNQSTNFEADHGQKLRSFIGSRRKALRLTQATLAIASGLPLGTVSGLESGRMVRCPRGITLEKLARGLQVPYAQLDALARGQEYEEEAPSPRMSTSSLNDDPVLRMFIEVMGNEDVPESERMMLQAKIRLLHQKFLRSQSS